MAFGYILLPPKKWFFLDPPMIIIIIIIIIFIIIITIIIIIIIIIFVVVVGCGVLSSPKTISSNCLYIVLVSYNQYNEKEMFVVKIVCYLETQAQAYRKTFSSVPGDGSHRVYPAAMKGAFRHHIRKTCLSPHCADSLVLYMNSPARNDGTSLLWDVNADGLVSRH